MVSLSHLNKLTQFLFFFSILVFDSAMAATAVDIWKKQDNQSEQNIEDNKEKKITIESPILSDDVNKISIEIDEQAIDKTNQKIVGLFDPEENNFNLNMWSTSNGEDIKKILYRINKLQLSQLSEDLLFKVLFTNAYPPKNNLTSEEFLKIKIDWLIKDRRIIDLEKLLKTNPIVGQQTKALRFLMDEYLASADIKSACEKINFVSKDIQDEYVDKFAIYCLIHNGQETEAQLNFELLKERGLEDKFFDNKINFLLGITEKTDEKILDDSLLNFFLSHITSNNFSYKPSDKTDKYVWRYLSSANLIQINNLENEEVILIYEKAASENDFEKEEIFNIYKKILFNINQLINSTEVYKNLPGYKSRALIYQSILLADNVEHKLYLAFLLKDLFDKEKLFNIYREEFSNILKSIDSSEIPESYTETVRRYLEKNFTSQKNIKFENETIHRSKVLKHFLDEDVKISKTEKDFKSVYKKIKKNKKYFISIKDIIVLESLKFDGVALPEGLDYIQLSSQLTVPKNLEDLAQQQQIGLVMLKIVEIIGEDDIYNLDSETIYFINRILNQLDLKKIRNYILSAALPVRV